MIHDRKKATIQSALWAAYGDALGFISELADTRILKQRTGTDKITGLNNWTRRIGGRFGVDICLPSGCYSDDTQLRLATSRAIQSQKNFDIEAFSKIELPVWLSYALGAGRGTKLAAANLTRKDSRWFSNFYSEGSSNYISSGGNGAAMRIQPHVWAADNPENPLSFLSDVLRNSISTHGHPRAIAGAVIHAISLGIVLSTGAPLRVVDLQRINQWVTRIPDLLASDSYLRDFWTPKLEELSNKSLHQAYTGIFNEVSEQTKAIADWASRNSHRSYSDIVKILDLCDINTRGSGTKTAVAAIAASMLTDRFTLEEILLEISNALGTDTDSIASMAGALMGAFSDEIHSFALQDRELIVQDATKLHLISQGLSVRNFTYPGLIGWIPPRSAIDSVYSENGHLFVTGLGLVEALSPASSAGTSRGDHVYQWVQTTFGQRLLIKRRSDKDLGIFNKATDSRKNSTPGELSSTPSNFSDISKKSTNTQKRTTKGIDDLSNEAISNNFDPRMIGMHILELSESDYGIEYVISYASIIAKARISRLRKAALDKAVHPDDQ